MKAARLVGSDHTLSQFSLPLLSDYIEEIAEGLFERMPFHSCVGWAEFLTLLIFFLLWIVDNVGTLPLDSLPIESLINDLERKNDESVVLEVEEVTKKDGGEDND